ncbi:MAG: MaoC/PaaZ C-terminal domain-containing protein [Thermodesulfobacteriota bacterium]
MGLNREYIGHNFNSIVHDVTEKEIHDYSLAIGARNLSYYIYDGKVGPDQIEGMAPPSLVVIYELPMLERIWKDPGLHGGEEEAKKNVLMLLHGDQKMKFFKPVRPGDKLTFNATITDIIVRGRGEILSFKVTSTNQNNEKVVESDWGLFIRGIESGKKPARPERKPENKPEEKPLLAFRKIIHVPTDVTYRYSKAAKDMNPIHIDESAAQDAGLKGIVVHGLCTMSMAMSAIIECYADSDPSRLKSICVRFTSPVYPGDTLIADGWEIELKNGLAKIGFEVARKEDGLKVIKRGTAEVSTV